MGTEIKSPLEREPAQPPPPPFFCLILTISVIFGNSGLYEVEVYLLHFF